MENNKNIKQQIEQLDKKLTSGLISKDEQKEANDIWDKSLDNNKYNKTELKPIVTVQNLSKKYSSKSTYAVNNISFNIYPGQFHVFIGPNGAGKTTTIKSIISAYSRYKYKGNIKINGFDNYMPEAKKSLGYIPEEAKFPKNMKLKVYLIKMAKLSGLSINEAEIKANKLIQELNLKDLENKCPNSFSSGQKKKVLLAQSLIHEPSVLIMDEPAANLDPLARDDLFKKLLDLQKQGKAIFLSSHILSEVEKYATYVTILNNGKILFDGPFDNKEKLIDLYKDNINNF